jgi:hypothetical protein
MKSFVLEFFIAARFANLAVSLPQYQFASHRFFVSKKNRVACRLSRLTGSCS